MYRSSYVARVSLWVWYVYSSWYNVLTFTTINKLFFINTFRNCSFFCFCYIFCPFRNKDESTLINNILCFLWGSICCLKTIKSSIVSTLWWFCELQFFLLRRFKLRNIHSKSFLNKTQYIFRVETLNKIHNIFNITGKWQSLKSKGNQNHLVYLLIIVCVCLLKIIV